MKTLSGAVPKIENRFITIKGNERTDAHFYYIFSKEN